MSSGNFAEDCRFYVNLGIYLPILHGSTIPAALKEYNCDFREDLGALAQGKATWWQMPADLSEISQQIIRLFHQHGQPWLDTNSSYDGIWREWEAINEERRKRVFGLAQTMIDLLTARGETDKARSILQEQYEYNLTEMPRRSELMRELAEKHGILLE